VRTDSNVYVYIYIYIYIYILLENRTGSLIELRSGSQSSLYHLLVPLILFMLLLLFSHGVALFV
jgi:hypothetical protein